MIPRDDVPSVMMCAPSSLRDNNSGMFDVERNTVYVRAGLADDETEQVLIHEFCHAYERMKHWLPSEGFARFMEDDLHSRWRAERTAA